MTDLPVNNLQPFRPSFPPTTASSAPSAETDRPKRRGGTRKAAEPAPAPKKERKPKIAKAAPKTGKLGINEIVSATLGLKEDEAAILLEIVGNLDNLKRASKGKVIATLNKLFG